MVVRFEVPKEVRYSCTQCGDCCRGWHILLGPGEEERIGGLEFGAEAGHVAGAAARSVEVKVPGLGRRRRLAQKRDVIAGNDEAECLFLGERQECLIHAHHGAEAKPLLCRLYPFGFYPMGDRIAVDVAFSCKAVSEGRGAEVTDRSLPEWADLLSEAAGAVDRRAHRLRGGLKVTPELMWEVEHTLVGLLEEGSLGLTDRVRACLQFLKLGLTGDPAKASAAVLRGAIASGLAKQMGKLAPPEPMDRTQRTAFFQWMFLCLNRPPENIHELPMMEKQAVERERLAVAERFQRQEGAPHVGGRDLACTFEEAQRVDAGIFEGEGPAVLRSFLRAKIVSQKFLIAGQGEESPLVEGVRQFFLVYPMTIWGAKALAAEEGCGAVELRHVGRALRLLDTTLGQVSILALPEKIREVYSFLLAETDWVMSATRDVMRVD
ncbi:MAG: YkgJ family cysteine cluster protein [Sumerlaeia bacterium]